MTWLSLARLTLALCLSIDFSPSQVPSQNAAPPVAEQPPPAPPVPAPPLPKPQFFGGTVTQLDASHITISRTPPGKATEHRTFLITARTKMTKAVKIRSRVTVRYQRLAQGDVALEIRIRPLMRTPRAS